MKERPIIFSGEMVRAILDGRKTMTRRVIKPQPKAGLYIQPMHGTSPDGVPFGDSSLWCQVGPDYPDDDSDLIRCPYGQPGDRLWVRETHVFESNYGVESEENYPPPFNDGRPTMRVSFEEDPDFGPYWKQPHYRATDSTPELAYPDSNDPECRWRPSIHMPRWASRITLEVTGIRVERLQEISEEDAIAEGIEHPFTEQECATVAGLEGTKPEDHGWRNYLWHGERGVSRKLIDSWPYQYSTYTSAIDSFSSAWELINAKRGYPWQSNPWVWVIEFQRLEE